MGILRSTGRGSDKTETLHILLFSGGGCRRLAIGIEAHVSIMESDALTTRTDKAMEDLHLCSNPLNIHEGSEGKEMHEIEGDINENGAQGLDRGELLNLEENCSELSTEDDQQIVSTDHIDIVEQGAACFNKDACTTLQDGTYASCDLLHQASREEDTDSIDRELSDLTQSEGSWEQMTYDSNTEEDYVTVGRKRNYSDLSTLRAASTASLVNSDSFILDAEVIEPEVDAEGKFLPSCDSLSSDMEYMDTNDIGMDDFSLVPMDSLHVSLVSNNSQMLNEIGAGSTAFTSLNFSITRADWHMASLPAKCLEMGAVNVASLTLGTVGISVIPMVSPGTIDINPFTNGLGMVPIEPIDWETWSTDSMSLATMSAEYVNVDSITPEGVRERWHPLEDRLCALGEALTALDKKLEGFSPRIQEAETLLNEVELSFSQHAMHISDIMKENNALAERVLLLEERLSREKQEQHLGDEK